MNHPVPMMVPVTDTTPTLIYVEGRPMAWLIDGRLRPFIAGGSGDDAGGEGAAGEGTEGEGAEGAGAEGGGTEGEGAPADPAAGAKKVELTQAELDEMIQKASGRAAKATEKRLADEAKKKNMGETERLQAEKAEADKRAADAQAAANARAIRADAKLAAVAADVDPKRIDAFLRTVDLSSIEVDEDGEPDAKAIAKAIKDGLAAIPEFKAAKGAARSGTDAGGSPEEGRPKDLGSAVAARLAKAS